MRIDVNVPDGVSGDWRVETFTVTKQDAMLSNIRALWRRHEYIEPATYKRLMRGRCVVMSNTPMEVSTNQPIIWRAKGDVLINGLGLGMVLTAILAKPDVRSVTVIENSPDVIALVAPSFTDKRLTILQADALDYSPPKGKRFDAVWHDIWDAICGDNLDDMKRLHRRYGRRTNWQGSWCRADCEMAN